VIEFQIHQAINREFYCRIVASNGEVLFISETYHTKQDLVHAANVVRAYAAHAQRFLPTSIPPRWPTSCTCRPRRCPAGPRKASSRS
jgi:uncharacterized protein YegP (UPF0339 family)